MSFIATAPTPPANERDRITNDAFWPDVSLAEAREALRTDGTVIDPRLRHALITAMIETARDLTQYKHDRLAEGYATLTDVPGEQIDGVPLVQHSYLRAVYCYAKADLIERLRDFDTAGAGQKRVDWLDDSPDEQRRNAAWAITQILNRPRCTVELI